MRAHACEGMHHGQAQRLQVVLRADARELQQPGRVDRARADDDLAPRAHRCGIPLRAAARVLHARGACTLEHDARRLRMGAHCQIGWRRAQVAARRALAPAAVDGALEVAHAGLGVAVVVGVARQALLLGAGDEGLADRMRPVDGRDRHPTRRATPCAVGRAQPALVAPEVGQHFGEGPARVAQGGPAVVVLGLAAVVDQAVDRARSAQRLALGQRHAPLQRARIGLGAVGPRVLGIEQHLDEAGRQMQVGMAVGRPGFEQADADGRVGFGQPPRHDGAGRARTDHHVVEAFLHLSAPRCCASSAADKTGTREAKAAE